MIYTPDNRVYLSAVPAFTGTASAAIIAIDGGANAWAQAARDQLAEERRAAREASPAANPLSRLMSGGWLVRRAPQPL